MEKVGLEDLGKSPMELCKNFKSSSFVKECECCTSFVKECECCTIRFSAMT